MSSDKLAPCAFCQTDDFGFVCTNACADFNAEEERSLWLKSDRLFSMWHEAQKKHPRSNDAVREFARLVIAASAEYSESMRALRYGSRHEAEKQAGPVAEPVGEAVSMPGTSGFTMACFKSADVPIGTKLYTAPPSPLTEQDKDDAELPPLPESQCYVKVWIDGAESLEGANSAYYTAEQMQDYARAARAKKEQP